MVNIPRFLSFLLINIVVLFFLAKNFPLSSVYMFMFLEIIGVLIIIYHELYSSNHADIVEYNKEVELYYDHRIPRFEKRMDTIFQREHNNLKHIEVHKLESYLLENNQFYKNENDHIQDMEKAKLEEKLEYGHYYSLLEKARFVLKFFVTKEVKSEKRPKILYTQANEYDPEYPKSISKFPALKNAILVIGYYLVLNGFLLQLFSQINSHVYSEVTEKNSPSEVYKNPEKTATIFQPSDKKDDRRENKSSLSQYPDEVDSDSVGTKIIGNKTSGK